VQLTHSSEHRPRAWMGYVVAYGTVPSNPRHNDGSIPLRTAIEVPEIQPPSKARVSLYSPECVEGVFSEVRELGSASVHQYHTREGDCPTDHRQGRGDLAQP
jgi:hypothetical protein